MQCKIRKKKWSNGRAIFATKLSWLLKIKVGKIDIPSMVCGGQLETHRHVWNNIKRVQWSNSEGKSVANGCIEW